MMLGSTFQNRNERFLFQVLHVDGRVHAVYILLIQLFPKQLDSLSKPLEVDNLPFPQEFDHIVHIRIITESQNVIIGHSRFLLWYVELFTTIFSSLIENK